MPWRSRTQQERAAGMDEGPTKEECLQHYATREPTYFVQLDGFDRGDEVMGMDEHGQSVMSGQTYELMSGNPAVRVLVRPGYPVERIVLLLDKIREWVTREDSPIQPTYWAEFYAERTPRVRTCEELAKDLFMHPDLGGDGLVSFEEVKDRMRHSLDHPSHERLVAAMEHLERDGLVWCLYDREGNLHGYRVNSCAFEPRGVDPDDDLPF